MSSVIDVIGFILKGGIVSLELFAITAVLSVPVGILVALGKISKNKILSSLLGLYTWAFRGSPLILQLFFIYFGLPALNIRLEAMTAASLAFVLNYAAYLAEIFRAGIQSVDFGQLEASKALGMSYRQSMQRIIIPQAFRNVLPPICSESINLIKDTSLIAIIGVGDLLRASKEVVTHNFTIYPFLIAGMAYLVISTLLVLFFNRIEKRYSVY
ncbi:MAG: amino acid ABC transporter permease [Solirubrobacterales bacterium]